MLRTWARDYGVTLRLRDRGRIGRRFVIVSVRSPLDGLWDDIYSLHDAIAVTGGTRPSTAQARFCAGRYRPVFVTRTTRSQLDSVVPTPGGDCQAPHQEARMRTVAKRLPEWAVPPLRHVRRVVRAIQYRGDERYCPVCKKTSREFAPFGVVPRNEAECVHCGSLERHRLLWLYLMNRTDLFDGRSKRMLHVAPERCFEPLLRQHLGDQYTTADLVGSRAMVEMDITRIGYPDQHFDVIYCGHVLEHVQDDRAAMKEFHRTLKSSGWAILTVPINDGQTYEDPTITEPAERLRVFGQEDHVRNYGRDYVDRLREAGFDVVITKSDELVKGDDVLRMGLTSASGEIYYCTKRSD